MAEKQIAIGIDFTKSYLRVAGLLLNKNEDTYNVIQGTKDVKVNSVSDDDLEEVVEAGFEDASDVVKSSMGGADIEAAFVVVPDSTSSEKRNAISSLSRKAISSASVLHVVSECTAAAAAYAKKVKPNNTINLAVVSLIGDILNITIFSVKPKDLPNEIYEYNFECGITYPQHIDFDQLEAAQKQMSIAAGLTDGILLIGAAAKALSDALQGGLNTVKAILNAPGLSKIPNVHAVVFTGNNKIPNLLRTAVRERYPHAKLWDQFKIDEVAAYGAAVLAFNYSKQAAISTAAAGSNVYTPIADKKKAIGIDFTKSYLRVAGVLNVRNQDTYSVVQATKDVKVNSTDDVPEGVVVAGFDDASVVVKYVMCGVDNIQSVFVVVIDTTSSKNRDAISSLGRKSISSASVLEVVSEHIAVAAAYASEIKPNDTVNLAVVSFIEEILNLTIISVTPKDLTNEIYEYNPQVGVSTYPERIQFNNSEANSTVKDILSTPELSKIPNVDALVFTGNNKIPNLLRTAVTERYPDAKLWDQFKIDEVAAYGAAVLAFNKMKTTAAA